ncbi:DUF4932 domain-containing protein [Flavobacterium sp. '19STA2R22 D10 B1']|uniref:DUF4932 domain-containing protein n=1 Tax=Flavobacterium aerium TaxID=3037261 RepID=UPI00278C8054|nr:DUF4932 domain-containing protein [Flavobacterium sp. '19STA2R22 D10 B1']
MKITLPVFFTIIFIIVLNFTTSLSAKERIQNPSKNEIIFKVDERTEFFRTIYNLAVDDVIDDKLKPCETEYYKSVKAYFNPYKNHPLMAYILNNDNIGVDFSVVGLMYKNFETFEFDSYYLDELKGMGISEQEIKEMKPLLLDFYKKSNFRKFFKSHQNYYLKAVENLKIEAEKEQLFESIEQFYQSQKEGLKFIIFVELTNNANNRALSFYEHNNPKTRALILTNLCTDINSPTETNKFLTLEGKRRILYHEISHIFTNELLNKYIGNISDYKSLCKECDEVKIRDYVDHAIVNPLQAILMKRLGNDTSGELYFLTECKDVRKDIYIRLALYNPKDIISFESVYKECIEILQKKSAEIK